MLAQNFKTAEELGISEAQLGALQKTLVMMETGKLSHVPQTDVKADFKVSSELNQFFNMIISYGHADCGSVGCIRGTAERVGRVEFPVLRGPKGLTDLFYNGVAIISDPSVSQAATALRSYLTTGAARWKLALSIG